MAQQEEGAKDVWLHRGREWIPENWAVKKLNEHYLDVGLTGKPHQVSFRVWPREGARLTAR